MIEFTCNVVELFLNVLSEIASLYVILCVMDFHLDFIFKFGAGKQLLNNQLRFASMAAQSPNSFSLKAIVHKDSNRVLFVESDNYFVDVLFSFLTMPMGTIVGLSDSHLPPMRVGCMNNLYESVENIDLQLLKTEECRAMLLHPRNAAESLLRCLKLKIDDSEPMHYLCDNPCCTFYRNSFSYYASVPCCGCGKLMDLGVNFLVKGGRVGGVFVDGLDKFIISDDLQVMLPFTSEFSSYLSKCGVVDLNDIEELTFNVGVDEVIIGQY